MRNASRPQIASVLLGLVGILLFVSYANSMSKKFRWRKPKKPNNSEPEPPHDAVSPESQPDDKSGDSPMAPAPTTNPEPPNKRKKETHHCRPQQTPVWKIILEVAAAIIGVGVLIIYSLQLKRMSEANVLTKQALISAQRPWVGLDEENPIETSPLKIDGNGTISIGYAIHAKNFGSSGAQSVFPTAKLVITQDLAPLPDMEKKFCNEPVSNRLGFVLFPGARDRATTFLGDFVTASQRIKVPGGDTYFQAWLIACVTYADQYGTFHHTVSELNLAQIVGTPGEHRAFEPQPNTIVEGHWSIYHSYFLD